MRWSQPLVGRVVLEIAVQKLSESTTLDEPFDGVRQRVIALHQVGGEQEASLAGGGDHRVCLLERHGQRLFAEDVFAVGQRRHALLVVQEGGRGDVDQVDVVAIQKGFDFLDVGHSKTVRGGPRSLTVRSRDGHRLNARQLGEMLEGEQSESAAADDPQPNHTCLLTLASQGDLVGWDKLAKRARARRFSAACNCSTQETSNGGPALTS